MSKMQGTLQLLYDYLIERENDIDTLKSLFEDRDAIDTYSKLDENHTLLESLEPGVRLYLILRYMADRSARETSVFDFDTNTAQDQARIASIVADAVKGDFPAISQVCGLPLLELYDLVEKNDREAYDGFLRLPIIDEPLAGPSQLGFDSFPISRESPSTAASSSIGTPPDFFDLDLDPFSECGLANTDTDLNPVLADSPVLPDPPVLPEEPIIAGNPQVQFFPEEVDARIAAAWERGVDGKYGCVWSRFFGGSCSETAGNVQLAARHILTHIPDTDGSALLSIRCTGRCTGAKACGGTARFNRIWALARHCQVSEGEAHGRQRRPQTTARSTPYLALERPWFWPTALFNGKGCVIETLPDEAAEAPPPGELRTPLEFIMGIINQYPELHLEGM